MQRYPAIDGLRGIAILAVIYQHAYAAQVVQRLSAHKIIPFFVSDGWTGVSLFFVLSGFVLTLPFIGRETDRLSRNGIRQFLVRRAKRLLPLFLFVSTIGFAMFCYADNLMALFLAVTTLHMFVPSQFYPLVNGAFWSLSIEIWASVALPFLILAAHRAGYIRVFVVVAGMAFAVRLISCLPGLSSAQALAIRDSVLGRLDDFAAGMVLALLFSRGILRQSRSWVFLLSLAILATTCVAIDLVNWGRWPDIVRPFSNIGFTAAFSLLIADSLSERPKLAMLLHSRPLRTLGMMCFSLYSWHNIFINGMHFSGSILGQISFWLVLMVVSTFTYVLIEFPNLPLYKLFPADLSSTENSFGQAASKPTSSFERA